MPLVVESLEDLAKLFDSLADQARTRQDAAKGETARARARGEEVAFTQAARVIRQTVIQKS